MHKSIFRTFGMALMAALCLMAAFAVAAQAADLTDGGTLGNFTVLGLDTLVANTTITGTGLHGILLIKGKNAYVLCASGHVVEAKGLNKEEVLARVRFLKCKAFNHTTNAALGACPVEGENALGEKETIDALAIGAAKLHEGKLFVVFQGHAGAEELFAEIKFGPECGIGVKVKVKGLVAAEVDNGNTAVGHLLTFSESIQKLMGTKLFYGTIATEAFVNGVAHVELSGNHTGCGWAVV